jgi:hypothetical protein
MQKKNWSTCKIFTLPPKIAKISKKFGIPLINTKKQDDITEKKSDCYALQAWDFSKKN